MKDLIGTKNAAFEIIEQGNKAVIGKRIGSRLEWVAWSYHFMNNGEPSFYWGHYTITENAALRAYNEKEKA